MPIRCRFARSLVAITALAVAPACSSSGGGGTGVFTATPRPSFTAAAAQPAAPPSLPPSPDPVRSIAPAAAAGGLCGQLSYSAVAAATGIQFGVAAAAGAPGRVQVCTLTQAGAAGADLTLTVTPAGLDAESFKLDYQPNGAIVLAGIGLAAYSQVSPGGPGAGPVAEIGWLTKKAVCTLTYTTAPGTGKAVAAKVAPGLAKLAKEIR